MDITSILSTIGTQGFIGLMLALSLWVNWLLYKENKDLQQKRVDDAQTTQKNTLQPLTQLQQSLDLIITLLQRSQ